MPSLAVAAATKVLRHNAVRDVVCSAVSEFTSVSPEVVRFAWDFSVSSLLAPPTSLRLLQRLRMFSTRSRLASVPSRPPPERGATFVPLVLEACGEEGERRGERGVGPTHCTRSFHRFASSHTSLRIAQGISCTLHRENARAILRRCSGLVGDQVPSSGW